MPIAPLVVLNVVGLTPRLLAHMPNLSRLAAEGFSAELGTILPAVTCSVQSTFVTGLLPSEHGVVGNGWYFRDLGEVYLWRQHNGLVGGEKIWDAARARRPDFRTANICWWYAMGATTDVTVTPRPIYHADGRKSPDCYTRPPRLHDELSAQLGTFPLFHYWGAAADIRSSGWIARAAEHVLVAERPDLELVYLPHLDYDLQRYGPDAPQAIAAAKEIDTTAGRLVAAARGLGATVVVLSEYGITGVSRPVDINRALRRAGLLEVYTQDGMEYLDPWESAAFAVADHQVAHVYVRHQDRIDAVREVLADLDGIDEVLGTEAQEAAGIRHERAGELVAISEPDAWFTYYYWLDDAHAPDFAKTVEIHRKPGYDPAELFMDPGDPRVKLRAGTALARKKLGLRYTLDIVPLDASYVRGSHGRLPDDPQDGPVLLCSDPARGADRFAATEVKGLLLDLAASG